MEREKSNLSIGEIMIINSLIIIKILVRWKLHIFSTGNSTIKFVTLSLKFNLSNLLNIIIMLLSYANLIILKS